MDSEMVITLMCGVKLRKETLDAIECATGLGRNEWIDDLSYWDRMLINRGDNGMAGFILMTSDKVVDFIPTFEESGILTHHSEQYGDTWSCAESETSIQYQWATHEWAKIINRDGLEAVLKPSLIMTNLDRASIINNMPLKPCDMDSQCFLVGKQLRHFSCDDTYAADRWVCAQCERSFHAGCSQGCADDMPDHCDDCWASAHYDEISVD